MQSIAHSIGLAFALTLFPAAAGADPAPPAPRKVVRPKAPATEGERTTTLVLKVTHFRSEKGDAKVALWRTPEGFPEDASKAVRRARFAIVGKEGTVTLEGLAPGPWALAVFHDENGNGKIDLGFFGIPREGLAVSRDAKGFLSSPSFDAARLVLLPGGRQEVRVRVFYY